MEQEKEIKKTLKKLKVCPLCGRACNDDELKNGENACYECWEK